MVGKPETKNTCFALGTFITENAVAFRRAFTLKKGVHTFALETLSEETSEELLAKLTDGGTSVVVYDEGVRHFDPIGVLLLHPQWPAAPRFGTTVGTKLAATHCWTWYSKH